MPDRPPPPPQRFVNYRPTLFRFRYEKVESLHVPDEHQPAWIMYRPITPGNLLRTSDEDRELAPGNIYVISPHTPFSLQLQHPRVRPPQPGFYAIMSPITDEDDESALIRQGYVLTLFAHFILGGDADRIPPGVHEVRCDRQLGAILDDVAALLRRVPGQTEFGPGDSCRLTGAIMEVMARLPATVWDRTALDARVEKVLRHIRDHPAADLSTPAMARLVHLSANALAALVREQTGESPQSLVRRYRLDHARLMLAHGDQSIEEITEACGFCDRFYFTRVFREVLGLPPVAYRRRTTLGGRAGMIR